MVETVAKKAGEDEHIVTLVASLPDGTHIVQHPDGRLERQKSRTDWARLDTMTDAEIEASIANDPDWSDEWNWSDAVLVLPPKKKAISIRVDEDVLDFFKKEGSGYQRRINAVLRRTVLVVSRIRLGDIEVDFEAHTARRGSTPLHLTHREFEILRYLAERRDRVVHRDELLREVWEIVDGSTTRAVDFAVARLRQKIEPNPPEPRFLRTVHGDGYSLTVDRDSR